MNIREYLEGHAAFFNNRERTENPYSGKLVKLDEYLAWDKGWSDAWRAQTEQLQKAGTK